MLSFFIYGILEKGEEVGKCRMTGFSGIWDFRADLNFV